MSENARRYDQTYYATSAIAQRSAIRWPAGATLALCFLVSCEYYELAPPHDAFIPANLPGGFGRGPYPDFRAFTQREYGNRVGVFRLLDTFARHGVKGTAALDAETAMRCGAVGAAFRREGWEIAAHGRAVTQVVSSAMTAEMETAYVASALADIEAACGVRPLGWHGPEYGELPRTPEILTRAGLRYVLDWPNDEQPFVMLPPGGGRLVSLAPALELDDVISIWQRRLSMDRWRDALYDSVDQLRKDGQGNGRHLIINLHPWLIGHPHRMSYLDEILTELKARDGVWMTNASAIADAYLAQTAASES